MANSSASEVSIGTKFIPEPGEEIETILKPIFAGSVLFTRDLLLDFDPPFGEILFKVYAKMVLPEVELTKFMFSDTGTGQSFVTSSVNDPCEKVALVKLPKPPFP